MKHTKVRTDQLEDLSRRLREFIAINRVAIDNQPDRQEFLDGQNMGYTTCLSLIKQIQKRGSIWRGSYDDGAGLSYEDTVSHLAEAYAINQELDEAMSDLFDRYD